jgi:hypothetical protein
LKAFDLIKDVLDAEFEQIPGTPAARRKKIDSCLSDLTTAYSDLLDPTNPPPDYDSPVTRFGYIYKYTPCHADIVATLLDEVDELRTLFMTDDWVRVTAIGGGPGSDFIGVLKHLVSRGRQARIKFYLLDAVAAWGDTWSAVEEHTDALDFQVSTHFQVLDVNNATTWENQRKYLKSELFTFIYFLSEVWRTKATALGFFHNIVANAASGSLFLFVDNDRSEFLQLMTQIAGSHLKKLEGGTRKYTMDWNEEKSSLEPFLSEFAHSPKLTAKIVWAVYRKE